MASWRNLTEYLSRIPEGDDVRSLSFDDIETIIRGELPPSSAKRWFWVNTPGRSYSHYWRSAGWHIAGKGVNMASRQVEFVRAGGAPLLARADTGTLKRRSDVRRVPMLAPSEIHVPLTDGEFGKLNSMSTAQKAVEIVKKHLRDKYSERNIEIREDVRGADIRVVFKDGSDKDEIIEVKGTVQPSIAWGQLKVSLRSSYDALVNGVPMYRVMGVDSRDPRIVVLSYGKDFLLEEECRWAVRPVSR